jgi:hypothetical protein
MDEIMNHESAVLVRTGSFVSLIVIFWLGEFIMIVEDLHLKNGSVHSMRLDQLT